MPIISVQNNKPSVDATGVVVDILLVVAVVETSAKEGWLSLYRPGFLESFLVVGQENLRYIAVVKFFSR